MFGEDKIYISGVMVQYFISCKRELWFYAHRINMNYNNEVSVKRIDS